jgi:AAA domain
VQQLRTAVVQNLEPAGFDPGRPPGSGRRRSPSRLSLGEKQRFRRATADKKKPKIPPQRTLQWHLYKCYNGVGKGMEGWAVIARRLSEIQAQAIDWLWLGWLASGKLTLVDGDAGLGKSWVALDLCARLSVGRAWPDGTAGIGAGNAIVFAGEDNDADTVLPRVAALGGDPSRVFAWPSEEPLPRLPGDFKRFERELKDSEARLAVLDPLAALLEPSVAGYNDLVREVLGELARIAQRRHCAILMLRNLNKQAYGPAMYRGLGAMTFLTHCRLTCLAGRDASHPDRCVLAPLKNNLASPASLAYRPGGDGVAWLGASSLTAEDLARRRQRVPRPAERRARAAKFLQTFLANGPRLARELWRTARRRRIARNTLLAAKAEIGATIERVPCKGEVYVFWLLPGQQLPEYFRSQ